ncbi:MAG: hypothetical protein WBM44_00505 [Waterburya sp.]
MNDRMKGMKLGNFSGIKKPQPEATKPPEPTPEPEVKPTEVKPAQTTKSKAKVLKKTSGKKLVTVNIKIRKDQKAWLTDTASTVRDNNTEPVPPAERVYPQHLIGVAIDLLEAAGVDWDEVRNVEELREQLNL